MLAVYDATNMTEKPPQTLIKNLFGQLFGALNATRWPQRSPHITCKRRHVNDPRPDETESDVIPRGRKQC